MTLTDSISFVVFYSGPCQLVKYQIECHDDFSLPAVPVAAGDSSSHPTITDLVTSLLEFSRRIATIKSDRMRLHSTSLRSLLLIMHRIWLPVILNTLLLVTAPLPCAIFGMTLK